jgi:hypothetical protein
MAGHIAVGGQPHGPIRANILSDSLAPWRGTGACVPGGLPICRSRQFDAMD